IAPSSPDGLSRKLAAASIGAGQAPVGILRRFRSGCTSRGSIGSAPGASSSFPQPSCRNAGKRRERCDWLPTSSLKGRSAEDSPGQSGGAGHPLGMPATPGHRPSAGQATRAAFEQGEPQPGRSNKQENPEVLSGASPLDISP